MKKVFGMFQKMSVQSKASIAYTLASLFTRGLTFITLPIFTRLMTTSEIGVTMNFASWYTILYTVVTLALTQGSLNIAFISMPEERDQYQSSVLTLSTFSGMIVFAVFLCNPQFWSNVFSLPVELCYVMFLCFIITPSTEIWIGRQRYSFNYKGVVGVSLLSSVGSSAVAVAAVIMANRKAAENVGTIKIVAQYSVVVVIAIFFFGYILVKGKVFFHRYYWSFALKLCIPLIVHSLAKHVMDVSDRTMIAKMVGSSEVGIYSVLQNVSTVSLIVWSAINSSLVPYMFEKMKEGKTKEINRVVQPLILVFGLVASGLTLIAPELVHILATDEYMEAIHIMPPIAAGIFLTALYTVYANILMYHKKTTTIMISTVIAASSNVILNYILIPKMGYVAAAYTTLISYIILSILQFVFSKRIQKEDMFSSKWIWTVAGTIVIFCMACNLIYDSFVLRYLVILMIGIGMLLKRKWIMEQLFAMKLSKKKM